MKVMKIESRQHAPQLRYYYDGYIYPFVGNASLKELIEMKDKMKSNNNFSFYNKDARNTYFAHLECVHECIRILFSEPDPSYAIEQLKQHPYKGNR